MHCHYCSLQDLDSFPTLFAMEEEKEESLDHLGVKLAITVTALLSL
jgi:hypothetical protein